MPRHLPALTGTARPLAALQVIEGQRAIPDTPGVQGDGVGIVGVSRDGGPVAEQDAIVGGFALRVAEPGGDLPVAQVGHPWCWGAALALQVQYALFGAEAHAGEVIGDDAQARHAGQVIGPQRRFVAVHGAQERDTVRTAQCRLHFPRIADGLLHSPLGRNAGVDQGVAVLVVHQGLLRQPVEQFLPIRRACRILSRVSERLGCAHPCGDRQQVQVVVAQHHDQAVAHFVEEAQGTSGIWGRG